MQQSTLLQSGPFGAGIPHPKPTASSQAKQRAWPKPSEVCVGAELYRYVNHCVSIGVDEWDESLGSRMELYCERYTVESVTPKGCRIHAPTGHDCHWGIRPVMDHYKNKFAYPSKGEALLGFIARKKRQQQILQSRLNGAAEAELIAERLLLKELQA